MKAEDTRVDLEAICRCSPSFARFLDKGFWDAAHVDLVWRYNGKDVREESDWLKALWYVIRNQPSLAHPEQGWQAIESAPKDGTSIVVRFRDDRHEPEVVKWIDDHLADERYRGALAA